MQEIVHSSQILHCRERELGGHLRYTSCVKNSNVVGRKSPFATTRSALDCIERPHNAYDP